MPQFKTPYAAANVAILVAACVYLMFDGSVDSTAFKVGSVLIGGLVARAAIAVTIGALNTATLMMFSSMALLTCGVALLSAETFKDHAIEGVAVGAATSALIVVGEFLERHRDRSPAATE